MTIEKIVGENIEKYFLISGMTLTNFGKQIDTPNTTYLRKMFSGEVSIGIGKLHKVASVLNVAVNDLVEGAEKLEPLFSTKAPKVQRELTKEHKHALRKRISELIGTQDAWKDVKENEAEIQRIRLILWGREEKVKDVTARQKQIIHQLIQNDRLSNAEVGRLVGCTREYVASIRREFKRGAYEGYTSDLYQVEVNILKLHSEGLDVREIANKLNIREDDVKNALEELEWLL